MTDKTIVEFPFLRSMTCTKRRAHGASRVQVVDFVPLLVPSYASAELPPVMEMTGARGEMGNYQLMETPDGKLVRTASLQGCDVAAFKGVVEGLRNSVRSGRIEPRSAVLDRFYRGVNHSVDVMLAEDVDKLVKDVLSSDEEEARAAFLSGPAEDIVLLDGNLRFCESEPVWRVVPGWDRPSRTRIELVPATSSLGRCFRFDRLREAMDYAKQLGFDPAKDTVPQAVDLGRRRWQHDEAPPALAELKSLTNSLWHNQFGSMHLSMQPLDFFSAFCGVRDADDLEEALGHALQMRGTLQRSPTSDEVRGKFLPRFDALLWSLENQRQPSAAMDAFSTARF